MDATVGQKRAGRPRAALRASDHRVAAIDCLRGVAILLVIVWHYGQNTTLPLLIRFVRRDRLPAVLLVRILAAVGREILATASPSHRSACAGRTGR